MKRGRRRKLTEEELKRLYEFYENNSYSLQDITEIAEEELGKPISKPTLSRRWKELGLDRKPEYNPRPGRLPDKGSKTAPARKMVALLITLGIVGGLILFAPSAAAVEVSITTDEDLYSSQPVTFTISVIIEDTELLPVDNLALDISTSGFEKRSVFSATGAPIENCENITITPLPVESGYYGYGYGTGYGYQDYGYGYGYGYDVTAGYGYYFGYGYGYGYQQIYPTQLKYEVKWWFTDDGAPDGDYSAFLDVNCSGDGAEHTYKSNTVLFTIDTTSPVISSIAASDITTSSAKIKWTTNEPATSVVEYGTSDAYGSVESDASLVTSHSITLTGLSASTTYHYRVKSADAATNESVSADHTFTTATPPVPPVPDFSISVSPTSGSVVQGGSTSATVSITSIAGFSDTVSLSASGLPSGATASFSPSSGTPSFSSTLTISTISTTPTGTYSITITGTGGGKTHSCTYTLTVTAVPVPDFSICISPASGSVVQGESTTATVSITSIAGFTDTVSLSASGLPSGATASFSPSSGTPSFSSALTISTISTTPTGTYSITITGTGGEKTHSCPYTLTVTSVVVPPNPFPWALVIGIIVAIVAVIVAIIVLYKRRLLGLPPFRRK